MRRITIITGLLAAALVPVASAHAGRPLARADAERVAVRHIRDSVAAAEANGLYKVTNTSHRCQRASSRRIACNFAIWLRGLKPSTSARFCLSSVAIVRTPGGRIIRQTGDLACA